MAGHFCLMFVAGFASLCLCSTGSGGMFVRRYFADMFSSQTSPSTLTDPVNDRAAVVVVLGLFCSLFNRDGSKLNCCLGCGGRHAV